MAKVNGLTGWKPAIHCAGFGSRTVRVLIGRALEAGRPQELIAIIGGVGFMKIRPLQDRILVKRLDEEEKTKGGIIIPDSAKEKPQEGKVIAVGGGKVSEDGKV